MTTYYNEFDPNAAAWLRELMKRGLIPDGVVDERSISDVTPSELREFTQCHFFAGIGGWPLALRLARWPDHRRVWTGSCPCQPFSTAGAGVGFADERHLWPDFHHLISESDVPVVFGEQVASKDGLAWFDLVQADLEGSGYRVGVADLCAAGVGAPQIRQRLWFVGLADADCSGHQSFARDSGLCVSDNGSPKSTVECGTARAFNRLADRHDTGLQGRWQSRRERAAERTVGPGGLVGRLADAVDSTGLPDLARSVIGTTQAFDGSVQVSGTDQTHTPWTDADWLYCRDNKWRPVESGTFPLADGLPARVGRLRGYGNAIVPEVAKIFIESVME